MDGIQNPALPKYIEYKGRTLLNISDQITKHEGTIDELTQMRPLTVDPEKCRRSQMPDFYGSNLVFAPMVSDAYKEIDAQMDDSIDLFLDGTLTEGELKDTFQSVLTRFYEVCDECGYPPPLGMMMIYGDQAMANSFFVDFRDRILEKAIERNDQEGLQYAANGKDGHWQYYNSDYYYKTESAISAIKDGAMDYCRQKGSPDFAFAEPGDWCELTDIEATRCDDFNSAWEHRFGVSMHQTFLDGDVAPPRDFIWFYEFGGKGKLYMYALKDTDPNTFDPENPLSARMWISYRGEDGKIHKVSKNFAFDGSASDLKSVADLLSFSGKDRDLTRFLQNLRVFSGGYFRQYPATRLDFRA